MTEQINLYQLFNTINNAKVLSAIAENANDKYNQPLWELYCDKLEPQVVDTWRRTLEEKEVAVKASVISANSSLPVRSISGGKEKFGNIVRMGHAFTMDANDIQELIRMGYYGDGIHQAYLKKLMEKTTAEVVGIHARINDMALQGVSTGKIKFDANNNPDGIPYEYDLGIPPANKLCCKDAALDWTDDTYSPLSDLKRMVEVAKAQNIGTIVTHFEMTQAKFDRLVSHPLTLAQYRLFAGYDASAPVANINSDIVWETLRSNLGLPYVLIIDEVSMIEVDGVPTVSSSSFAPTNVILRGSSSFYDLFNTIPLNLYDNNPATITTSIENDMIVIQKNFSSDPIMEKIGFEAMAMPVPKNPKNVIILNTEKSDASGLGI